MSRIDVRLSEEVDTLLETAVELGMFTGPSDAARTVLREYFESHDEERLAVVKMLYHADQISYLEAVRLGNINPAALKTRIESREP
jgi:Arc/MetJ-type ribon-helix-helix transcriptional regulator